MSKLWVVFRQEYLNRVRTRGFVIGTLLLPVFMILIMVLPALLMTMDVEQAGRYLVVDSTGVLFEPLTAALSDSNEAGERLFQLEEVPLGAMQSESTTDPGGQVSHPTAERTAPAESDPIANLNARVVSDEVAGFFVLGKGLLEGDGGSQGAFYAKNVADEERNAHLRRVLEEVVRERRVERSELANQDIERIMRPVSLRTYRVREEGTASADEGHTFILAYLFGFLFYFSMFNFGIMTLRTTLEEKTQRSAELMVSTVRPFQLMGGKVLGVAAVALTQMAIWVGASALVIGQGVGIPGGMESALQEIQSAAPSATVVAFFFIYFILGFLLYSGIFVAVGAMVSTETEAQQLQFPATMPILLSFLMMFLAIRAPNGTLTTVLSLIPIFSPILMMVRITVLMPPAWQIALSILLLIVSVIGSMWLAARIFRVGLLMYGKRPNLPELMKWVRYG